MESQSCCGPDCCSPTTQLKSAAAIATDGEQVRATVRERYGAAAQRAVEGQPASCGCGTSCCSDKAGEWDPITSDLYDAGEVNGIPQAALLASLGCGNPTALAELHEGERVLDLGSGGGIDVLLSARRVGPAGKAYGLDMTPEMLRLARENQKKSGLTNVEFLRGEIENIPLPDESVDVIISNCVINLSADKGKVLREAFRVLNRGGRFAVSDIVLRGDLPAAIRDSVSMYVGCIGGALTEEEYTRLLAEAGFENIGIEPTRVYSDDDMQALIESAGLDAPGQLGAVGGKVMSAFIRATRPAS